MSKCNIQKVHKKSHWFWRSPAFSWSSSWCRSQDASLRTSQRRLHHGGRGEDHTCCYQRNDKENCRKFDERTIAWHYQESSPGISPSLHIIHRNGQKWHDIMPVSKSSSQNCRSRRKDEARYKVLPLATVHQPHSPPMQGPFEPNFGWNLSARNANWREVILWANQPPPLHICLPFGGPRWWLCFPRPPRIQSLVVGTHQPRRLQRWQMDP